MPKPVKRSAETEAVQPESSITHDTDEKTYETLDNLCSEFILVGPGGYKLKTLEAQRLSSIQSHREVFDFSEKVIDHLVIRLRIFDLIRGIGLTELQNYSDDDWTHLMTELSTLRTVLLSRNAQSTHIPIFRGFDSGVKYFSDADIPFDSVKNIKAKVVNECFQEPFNHIIRECNVQRVLSTIRNKLEMVDQLTDGPGIETLTLVLAAQHMQAFLDAIDKYSDSDETLREFFLSMLKFDKETVLGLIPAVELKKKVENHQLYAFLTSLQLLLQNWSTTLENSSSTVQYHRTTGGEIVVQAFAIQQPFSPSVDDSEKDLPILSSPPPPTRSSIVVTKSDASPKRTENDGKKKRMRFTEDEKNSIKQGLDIHGKGNWAAIKKEYADVLANRTSVQIKVRINM